MRQICQGHFFPIHHRRPYSCWSPWDAQGQGVWKGCQRSRSQEEGIPCLHNLCRMARVLWRKSQAINQGKPRPRLQPFQGQYSSVERGCFLSRFSWKSAPTLKMIFDEDDLSDPSLMTLPTCLKTENLSTLLPSPTRMPALQAVYWWWTPTVSFT